MVASRRARLRNNTRWCRTFPRCSTFFWQSNYDNDIVGGMILVRGTIDARGPAACGFLRRVYVAGIRRRTSCYGATRVGNTPHVNPLLRTPVRSSWRLPYTTTGLPQKYRMRRVVRLRSVQLGSVWLGSPRGERWGRKNMCFCETNPIVMLANRPVTYSPAVGCVHERENLNRVRLGKPNPFWRGSVGSFGSAQSPCATPFGRRHYATPSPRRLDLRQLRVCASRADFASTPEQDLLTSLVRTCRRPPTNHWRP